MIKRNKRKGTRRTEKGKRPRRLHSSQLSAVLGKIVFTCLVVDFIILLISVLYPPLIMIDETVLINRREILYEEPSNQPSLAPAPPVSEYESSLPAPGVELPLVAIIIDDMGYNEKLDREFIALPLPLTFAFLP